jgi:hypothetical protein
MLAGAEACRVGHGLPTVFRSRSIAALGLIVAVALGLALWAGCGSNGSGDSTGNVPPESIQGPPPKALLGTYGVALKPGDLPPRPSPRERVLTESPPTWKLTIANSGGPSGGRDFAISSTDPALGLLEQSDFGVQGNLLALHQEECQSPQGYVFHENEYRWDLSGNSLRFSTISNSCPDRVAETILTSRTWSKVR